MHPNDGRVVSNFIMQALQGKPITINGKGNQTRSFCFVDDLIDGLIGFMNTKDDITGPVNLGNPNEFSILDLAHKVIKLTNSKSELIFNPLPEDDPTQRQPNTTLAHRLLEWQSTTELNEGLIKTIEYFSKVLKK